MLFRKVTCPNCEKVTNVFFIKFTNYIQIRAICHECKKEYYL